MCSFLPELLQHTIWLTFRRSRLLRSVENSQTGFTKMLTHIPLPFAISSRSDKFEGLMESGYAENVPVARLRGRVDI